MLFKMGKRWGFIVGAMVLAGCVAEGGGSGPNYRPLPAPPVHSGPVQNQACPANYMPVCGERNGQRQTMANQCMARANGYRIVSRGECTAKPGNASPDNGWGGGQSVRPPRPPHNSSQRPQRPSASACTREYMPVCAQRGSDRRSFSNSCMAQNEGYRIIGNGQCR